MRVGAEQHAAVGQQGGGAGELAAAQAQGGAVQPRGVAVLPAGQCQAGRLGARDRQLGVGLGGGCEAAVGQ